MYALAQDIFRICWHGRDVPLLRLQKKVLRGGEVRTAWLVAGLDLV